MDIQQIIKDRYKELPKDIQQAIKSTDLAGKFEAIAKTHGLHIDQNGSLQTETLLVMLGLERTGDYVDNIQKELDISRNEALSIAEDVNKNIFNDIRSSLRAIEEQTETETSIPETQQGTIDISSLERAGNFSIEKPAPASTSPQYKESSLNRNEILKGIEDPDHIPMVDHLLTTPVNNPSKVEEVKKPAEPQKPYTADPYREAF